MTGDTSMDASAPSSAGSKRNPKQALRDFELALETAGFGTWTWDVPSGEVRWLRAAGRANYLPDGSAGRVHGVLQDVTRQREIGRASCRERVLRLV